MMKLVFIFALALSHVANARYLLYLDSYHASSLPDKSLVAGVTHISLAFMSSTTFNSPSAGTFPLFTTVDAIKELYGSDVKVIVSIGGWGDTAGFSSGSATDSSRKLFANNVKAMLDYTGADGVDIDWEYPGGNGEDYKQIPNSAKVSEITTYPQLLSEIRAAIGDSKIMCAAVPGLQRDMIAFTNDTIPKIITSLDFMNIMTYDLMNRRDNVTKHHTSIEGSIDSIEAYLGYGVPPAKANLGFAFYAKWFTTDSGAGCASNPIGCKTVLLENPDGSDTGRSGALTFTSDGGGTSDAVAASWQKALVGGKTDDSAGGQYFWDADTNIFWTWDTPALITKKFSSIIQKYNLGGVFAWTIGEDSADWSHLKALTEGVENATILTSTALSSILPSASSLSSSSSLSVVPITFTSSPLQSIMSGSNANTTSSATGNPSASSQRSTSGTASDSPPFAFSRARPSILFFGSWILLFATMGSFMI